MLDEEVRDPTAVKIRTLALGQFNRRALVQGVQRLGDASWTTNVQEQGHASGAVLHKIHTRYGAKMLSGRAFIHMIRPLFQHSSQDKAMARLEQAQAALRRKVPERISGRHVFYAELVQTATRRGDGQAPSKQIRMTLVRQHSSWYQTLPADARRMYTAMARRTAECKRRDIDEEEEHLAARAQLHRSNMYAERLKDAEKCRMTNARFADEDLEAMAVSWGSGAFRRAKVAALRDAAVVPPLMPSPEVRARLGEAAVVEEPRQVLAPWCVEICKHRESFAETVLVIEGEMPTAYLVLFAMQSPYFAAFAQVVRLGGVVPSSSGALALRRAVGELSPHAYDHCFCIDWKMTVTGLDIVCEDLASAYVVSDVVAIGSDIVASNARAVPFDEFLSSLPPKPPSDDTAEAPRAPAIPILGLPKYGWLDRYMGHDSGDGVGARPSGSSGDPVPLVGAPLDDDEAEQVFVELD